MQQYPSCLEKPLSNYKKELDADNPIVAFLYMRDFFESCAQYFSIVLLALFKKHREIIPNLKHVNKVINHIDTQRNLSAGDWTNSILNQLLFDARQQFPENPFVKSLIEICDKQNHVFLGGKNSRSIANIRNKSLAGHDCTKRNGAIELIEELKGRIGKLEKVSREVVNCGLDLSKDLYPLVHTDENGFLYVFKTLTNPDKINFGSYDEEAKSKEVKLYNLEFERWIKDLVPSFEIRNKLNWLEICSKANTTMDFINDNKDDDKTKKYKREEFVERHEMKELYDGFDKSDKLFFPLIGEAGQGKSTQLCHWAETKNGDDEFTLFLSGSEFASTTIEERICEIFFPEAKHVDIPTMTEWFCEAARERGINRKLYFFIDAVNEAIKYPGSDKDNGPQAFYQDLYSQFEGASGDYVKVILTCRSYTWKKQITPLLAEQNLSLFYMQENDTPSSLNVFLDQEIEEAYGKYKKSFQIETDYTDIPKKCALRLKDPLLLNFVCTTFQNNNLPIQSFNYTSINLLNQLLEKKRKEIRGKDQVRILELIAERIFKDYETAEPTDNIAKPSPQDESELSHLMYYDSKSSTAYSLLENDKTYIITTHDNKIQFVYERFLEFMLARHCYLRERKSLPANQPIPADRILRIFLSSKVRNEVFVNVMQNVLIMDYTATGDPGTIINLLKNNGHNFEVFNLVSATLNTMIHENYEEDIFKLEQELISHIPDDELDFIKEYDKISKTIDSNLTNTEAIEQHTQLLKRLAPLIRLRNLAAASIVNGLLLTDFNNEGLYDVDPYSLLWLLMEDPFTEVRNNTCMLVYYVSMKEKTLTGSSLKESITKVIIDKMHQYLLESSLFRHILTTPRRTRAINFLETATRLNVLRIIDLMLTERPEDRELALTYLEDTRQVVAHITSQYRMIRVMMPFLNIIIKRQLTFQSAYVNNIKEYSLFWDESVVQKTAEGGNWSRNKMVDVSQFLYLYCKFFDHAAHTLKPEAPDFSDFEDASVSAYMTGDSFSYFVMERILVVVGIVSWDLVAPILQNIEKSSQQSKWHDYSQMSLIYIMYQLGLKMDEMPDILWEMLNRNCVDWTERCRGYFKARNSENANALGLYKRNVMTWYACVWCARHGDNEGDQNAPLFRELINKAIDNHDKELLVHLILNIAELITDSGYIHTALGLLKIILERISDETIKKFDDNVSYRYPDTTSDLVPLIGKTLGTASNYYPQEVNNFLTVKADNLKFPDIQKFRKETLGFNPGSERLPDLFTHKFGNFIIWAMIHEQSVDDTVVECLAKATQTNNITDFFENCTKIIFKHLFNIKL